MAWNGSFKPLKSYIECGLAVNCSRLETAALPTELYPCICVKLFSLQAFLPARSIIPQTTPKSQDFLKNSVVKSANFWAVISCRMIKRHQEEGDSSTGSEWRFFLIKSSAYRPYFPWTETTDHTRLKSWKRFKSWGFAAIGLWGR